MQIGIIGSGSIGGTLGKLWAQAGHSVLFSSRHPEQLRPLAIEAGNGAQVGSVEDAAQFGELVLIAIPFGLYTHLPVELLKGRIVVDANNYYPQRDGHIPELDTNQTTSSELLAAHLPETRVIKAFNTIYFEDLANQGDTTLPYEERRAIFVAGDDPEAKRLIMAIIEEIGFGPVDTGNLADGGRRQQPGTPVYNKGMTVREAKSALSGNS